MDGKYRREHRASADEVETELRNCHMSRAKTGYPIL